MYKLFHTKLTVGMLCMAVVACCWGEVMASSLAVGPDKPYRTIASALAVAADADIIEVDAGVYVNDYCVVRQHNLTIRGKGGRAHISANGLIPNGKGIILQRGRNLTLENLELSGAAVADQNGAGYRCDNGGSNVVIRHCYFHHNENGILLGIIDPNNEVLIENSEFAYNGSGTGQTHNIYVGHVKKFTLRFSYSHDANVGHLVKSRANENFILYNRLTGENGTNSYEIDLPNGGNSYIVGNVIQQSPRSENGGFISYAREVNAANAWNPGRECYVINNTMVNDRSQGCFVMYHKDTALVKLQNNIFAGSATLYDSPGGMAPERVSNLIVNSDPGFVNRSAFDYHLTSSTIAAIDQGTAPGMANGFNLTPAYEYEHVALSSPRPAAIKIDIGAHEFSLNGEDEGEDETEKVHAYPNPYWPGSGGRYDGSGVVFSNLPISAKIQIYTIHGTLLRTLESSSERRTCTWDGLTTGGDAVASGVYFVRVEGSGRVQTLKVVVQR